MCACSMLFGFVSLLLRRFLPPQHPEHLSVNFEEDTEKKERLEELKCLVGNEKAVLIYPVAGRALCYVLALCVQALKAAKAASRRLDFSAWLVAWDRAALGSAAVGMMPFAVAMAHKRNVTEAQLLQRPGHSTCVWGVRRLMAGGSHCCS